jgi:SAM-dependent methyltransferase
MSVFSEKYASYYDLFYAEKDYAAETAFVRGVIERHRPKARSLLELGCGSARHAVEFARAGLSVTGVDRSAEMIARAHDRIGELSGDQRGQIKLLQGDAAEYQSTSVYDAVVSLFHVVSYQTTNNALNGIFRSARSAVAVDGLFVFDFWYGPAVLTQTPQVRVRRVSAADVHITRIAEPEHDVNRNVVDVKYTLIAVDRRTGLTEQDTDVHSMRYLFLPEIEFLATQNDFELIEFGEWLTGKSLGQACWSGYAVARGSALRG